MLFLFLQLSPLVVEICGDRYKTQYEVTVWNTLIQLPWLYKCFHGPTRTTGFFMGDLLDLDLSWKLQWRCQKQIRQYVTKFCFPFKFVLNTPSNSFHKKKLNVNGYHYWQNIILKCWTIQFTVISIKFSRSERCHVKTPRVGLCHTYLFPCL